MLPSAEPIPALGAAALFEAELCWAHVSQSVLACAGPIHSTVRNALCLNVASQRGEIGSERAQVVL